MLFDHPVFDLTDSIARQSQDLLFAGAEKMEAFAAWELENGLGAEVDGEGGPVAGVEKKSGASPCGAKEEDGGILADVQPVGEVKEGEENEARSQSEQTADPPGAAADASKVAVFASVSTPSKEAMTVMSVSPETFSVSKLSAESVTSLVAPAETRFTVSRPL